MKFSIVFAATTAASLIANAAAAAEWMLYEASGPWNVYNNAETGGCMMEQAHNEGHAIQMGVGAEGAGFLWLCGRLLTDPDGSGRR